jgi:hypothetical protein
MRINRRAFLGLAAAAAAHQATKGLSAEAEPIPVNFDDIRIGQWADNPSTYAEYTSTFEVEAEGPFYTGAIHPFFVADLLADETIGPALRKQLMCVPLSGGEAI